MEPEKTAGTELRHHLGVVWRRKWIIIQFLIAVPLVAYFLESRGEPLYHASSEVLLSRQDYSASLLQIDNPDFWNPERMMQTQARLARAPDIARRVVERANLDKEPWEFLAQSAVKPDATSDVMTFGVSDRDPDEASRLATVYAEEYIAYRQDVETATLRSVLNNLETQIAELRREGRTESTLYETLIDKRQTLETAQALQGSNARLIRPAGGATQIAPRPMRTALLGLILAVILGLGLAFVLDALDSRVRSPDEIAEALGLPLLARLAAPGPRFRGKRRLVMLETPEASEAEPYRMLRTNLDFVSLDRAATSIMVSSAVEQEGKSTTVANLAVALARAGRRVALVDLDLRRPSLDSFFALDRRPGLTDVVLGRLDLEDALVQVSPERFDVQRSVGSRVSRSYGRRGGGRSENGASTPAGTLEVLGSGPIPPNPGEFVATAALDAVLEQLQERADIVLVDGPPLLLTGDTLTLSAKVDAIIIVARLNVFRRPMVRELNRFLAATPAAKLGLVVTDAASEATRGYYYSSRQEAPQREGEKVG